MIRSIFEFEKSLRIFSSESVESFRLINRSQKSTQNSTEIKRFRKDLANTKNVIIKKVIIRRSTRGEERRGEARGPHIWEMAP